MKNFRVFSLFFCFILMFHLCLPVLAAGGGTGGEEGTGEPAGNAGEPVENTGEPAGNIGETIGDVGEGDTVARAALLADPDTGEILFARNVHERLFPTSLTMMMTALLTLEAVDEGQLALDTVLTVTETALADINTNRGTADLLVGEQMTVENLLYCIIVVSASDAANVLAEGVSGSVDTFITQMNQRAEELGCTDTQFLNANGMQNAQQYSSVWDMYLIAREVRGHEIYMRLCGMKAVEIPATNLSSSRQYWSTNFLMDHHRNGNYVYRGANGLKAGSSGEADYCLAASASRDGRSLLAVIMGASLVTSEDGARDYQSFSEAVRLLNWGFEGFARAVILQEKELIDEVPVTLSQEQSSVKVHPSMAVERLIPTDVAATDIRRIITLPDEVEAPVTKGQVLGQLTLSYGNTVYATVDLLADEDVSVSRILMARRDLIEFIHRPILKIAAAGILALLVFIVVLKAIITSRRRRRRQMNHYRPTRQPMNYRGRRR